MVIATTRPLYPRESDPVPIIYEAGWAPGPVWTGAEILAPQPGFDPRTVQPVASRYTDCAFPAHILRGMEGKSSVLQRLTAVVSSATARFPEKAGYIPDLR